MAPDLKYVLVANVPACIWHMHASHIIINALILWPKKCNLLKYSIFFYVEKLAMPAEII